MLMVMRRERRTRLIELWVLLGFRLAFVSEKCLFDNNI